MSFIPAIRKRHAPQRPIVRQLGMLDAALRHPIDRDIAAGHIEFATMIERSLSRIGLTEACGND